MTSPSSPVPTPPTVRGPGFPEFVGLIAAMMALNALAIDSMLPALPAIGGDLGVAHENSRQWVVTAFLLGFGAAQLAYGPLADRYGRRPVLLAGIGLYGLFAAVCAFSPSFETLLLARFGMGLGAAGTRVLAVSIVRDRYSGRAMARVMSLSFLVFLGVPILAPSLGQAILMLGPWRWIFAVLAAAAIAVGLWSALRLPESLKPEDRLPIQPRRIASAFGQALTERTSIGYTLAMTMMTGGLFGFINSSQQIFQDVFRAPEIFPLVFALAASGMAASSLLNARLVDRYGSRLLSHGALFGFIIMATAHATLSALGHETVAVFAVMQGLTLFFFGFIAGNFGAMAMERMGHIAGTASAAQGFVSTIGGALIGFFIGQGFNGSATPMLAGIAICGTAALLGVLLAERGRLFRSQHQPG